MKIVLNHKWRWVMHSLVLALILTEGHTAVTAETETVEETEKQQDTEQITEYFTEQFTEQTTGKDEFFEETEEEETENWLDQMDDWMEQEEDIDFREEDSEEPEADDRPMPETEEFQAVQEPMDLTNYLPVQFLPGISSLDWFPKEAKIARVVQSGYQMIEIAPRNAEETGTMGAYYRKAARQGEKWYDLKMTLTESESEKVISKEGSMNIQTGVSFCTDRIGWGFQGQQGKTVLKMEFVESGTDIPALINTRFLWKNAASGNYPQVTLEDGSIETHYNPERGQGDSEEMFFLLKECSTWYMTWENQGNHSAAVICQEDVYPAQTENEISPEKNVKTEKEESAGEKIIRQDASVRLFVSQRDSVTKQRIENTVFEVYEWDGYEYAIYRGCLTYMEEKRLYTMDRLVRNEVNQGKYKIVEAAGSGSSPPGWEQEVLVPEMPVVTDLYYHVEE